MSTVDCTDVSPLGSRAAQWPLTAYSGPGGDVLVGGISLNRVVAQYGTPCYLLDEADIRRRCHDYLRAFDGEVAYAAKAFLCRAMLDWVARQGLSLDVCSAGELAVAAAVAFPAQRMLMHGNAKTPQDLAAALAYGVDRIVLDCHTAITRLAAMTGAGRPHGRQRVLVRVAPGVDGHTHRSLTTGTDDQQFGFGLTGGAADEAVARVLGHPNLDLVGLHCHLGSQIEHADAFERAASLMIGLMARVRDRYGITLPQLDLGGGHAVAYRDFDTGSTPAEPARRLTTAVAQACERHRLRPPRLIVEPGRAISARAGVTVYRVLAVNRPDLGGCSSRWTEE